jgi:hypothetical protein
MSEIPFDKAPAKSVWPFPKWHPLLAGALLGIVFRVWHFTGSPDTAYAVMSLSFITFVPFAVGAVTVYVAERTERRSWSYYALHGMGANVMFILGTMLIMVEGLICAVIIVPMFAVYGAVAGLVMGALCRATNWPRQAACGFLFLPVLLSGILPGGAGETYIGTRERTVLIQASPAAVWRQLHYAPQISPAEVERAWLYRIGVPVPMSAITKPVGTTLERDITMGKAIHFTQFANEWRENSFVKWQYRFADDSFPPQALDDHVKIGGHYFDLIDTVYTLTPRGAATELRVSMQYRVSTQFNWYSKRVAAVLFDNFEEVILDYYARRAEQPTAG